MPAYFRLQDLKTIDASVSSSQRIEDAIDVGAYATLVVQVRKPIAAVGTTADLILEHAATLDEEAFVAMAGSSFDLKLAAANSVLTYSNPLRYVRWAVTFISVSTNPQVIIDLVAREN